MDSGPFEPEDAALATPADRLCGRATGVEPGEADAASSPPDWSARIVTVWIFFGAEEARVGGGAGIGAAVGAAGCAAIGGGAGQTESAADATCPVIVWLGMAWLGMVWPDATGMPRPGGIEPCSPPSLMTGTVETTRGVALGGSIVTGCSSRDTTFSVEPVVVTPLCFESPASFACASP